MQRRNTDSTRRTHVINTLKWLPYKVNQSPYFGSFVDTLDKNKLHLCLTSLKTCPFLVEFEAFEIKEQASRQGFVFKTLEDVIDQVFAYLKQPSEELQFSYSGKQITFKIVVSRELCLTLESPTRQIEEPQRSSIFQSLSSSFFDNQVLLREIVDDLHNIITCKDQGLAFLMDSLRDVGFESLIKKWAPRGSFNHDLLQPFDFDEWFNKWPSPAKTLHQGTGYSPKVCKFLWLLSTKPNFVSQQNTSISPKAQTKVLSSGDEFASLSFAEDEQNETHFSHESESDDTKHLCGRLQRASTPIETESLGKQIRLADVPILSSQKTERLSRSPKQPSPTPEGQIEDMQEQSEDRSPSRKRRKFGKLRIE